MADKAKQKARRSELANLREELGPYFTRAPRSRADSTDTRSSHSRNNSIGSPVTPTSAAGATKKSTTMSQRNRSGRGSNRANGNSSHGEEAQIWEACKGQMADIVNGINAENDSLAELVDLDKKVGAMDGDAIPGESLKQMEQLCRTGVKHSEANITNLKAVTEQLKILRAVVVAKEQAEAAASAPPAKRANTRDSAAAAAAAASLYDFDGAGDSPVPSPIGSSSRKYGERASTRGADKGDRDSHKDRDSVPPKSESVEPQGPAPRDAGSATANKSKVVFSKGDAVAFKPKAGAEGAPDWILGEVAQVLGEGKSRRYKVLDIEPEDQSKQKEYRTSASSMIPITPESQVAGLKEWEAGQVVLALYPNTTTFYMAEVHGQDGNGRVNLKFEGEDNSTTLQQVERRFVIEYRA